MGRVLLGLSCNPERMIMNDESKTQGCGAGSVCCPPWHKAVAAKGSLATLPGPSVVPKS